ncbi:DUF6518 family protein [Neobacillus mesonae]|uniref:DUF6518 family protein n=1 Tax=Neobacillus mesonae TaxID=1193713 RepID=UPI0008375590|nr:DUF6518 family protein [Neobacillus mesonae]
MTRNNVLMKSLRLSIVLVMAMVFGILMAVFKGNGSGIRMAIGNSSAPWMILPFVAAAISTRHRVIQSALVGLGASLIGLFGFYFANIFVLDIGPHPELSPYPWVADFLATLRSGKIYFILACLSGPIFGILGGFLHQKRSNMILVFTATLFVLEPCFGLIYVRFFSGFTYSFTYYVDYPMVWLVEAVFGVILFILIIVRFQPTKRS